MNKYIDSSPAMRKIWVPGSRYLLNSIQFVLILLLSFAGTVQAQEICNNGIDDDSDGYIDCYDADCVNFGACDSVYLGGPIPGCQFVPGPATLSLTEVWRTNNTLYPMDNRQTPVVGDIDGDGIPEVIARNVNLSNALYVFDGITGAQKASFNSPPSDVFLDAVCIGDVDNDGFGEVITVAEGNVSTRRLYCYEHTGTLKWVSSVAVGFGANDDRWTPALADFDLDGTPEVYVGNQIFNALTGALIATAPSTSSKGASPISPDEPFPVAADVLPSFTCPNCAGLELICGNTVYSVNIGSGTLNPERVFAAMGDGPTSIVDLDMDGDLDAVVVTSVSGSGMVYAWDLQTLVQIGSTFQIDNATAAGINLTSAGGHANVADFNGDGSPEIGLAGHDVYLVLDLQGGNLVELWSQATQDGSQRTGSSVFDFQGDGANEVIYRDETTLFVYNGLNGNTLISLPCPASTRYDIPVVVDVNADGQTNIVCACADYVVAYETGAGPWVAARQVWNQHSYFAVNINDDLTIPQQQQGHHLGFPSNSPTNFTLNSFLTQSTLLDFQGNPQFSVPDDSVAIVNPLTDMDYSGCQNAISDSIGAAPTVFNLGDNTLPAGTFVSFYAGDPYQNGAMLLATVQVPTSIPPGQSAIMPLTYFPDQGGAFDLYCQVNDDGTNPIPMTLPASGHAECDLTNNLSLLAIVSCGNNPPVIDTSGFVTDTIFVTLPEDSLITICPNGIDPQGDTWDITQNVIMPTLGTVTGFGDGDSCFVYTGNLNTNGVDTLTVVYCDFAAIPLCDTLTVIVTITPVNDPPRAFNDAATIQEDTPTQIPVQDNDSDVDGDPLTTIVYINAQNGNATTNGDSILYTPNPNYTGPDTIVYVVCDNGTPQYCDTAFVYINVVNVNDPPVGVTDTIMAPNALPNQVIFPLSNDTDVDGDQLNIAGILSGPTNGTATVSGDSIIYTPDPSYLGPDTIFYILCDNGNPPLCDTAMIIIDVTNANVPPFAVNDTLIGVSGVPTNFDVLANDSDPNGHTLVVSAITCGPQNGTATIDSVNNVVIYTANTLYVGPDTLCYVACDIPPAGPPFCDTAFVFIDVISNNAPPIAVDDIVTVSTGLTTDIPVLTNDIDPDGDPLTVTILVPPVNGNAGVNGGQVSYTPDNAFLGPDSLQYEICDAPVAGPSLCDTAWVLITVDEGGITVDNGFSPNGDGANDVLVISGLSIYPNHRVSIFSRWGSTIFEGVNYNNDWDGTRNGEPVPDGTYFYVIDPGDGSAPVSGYIVIFR